MQKMHYADSVKYACLQGGDMVEAACFLVGLVLGVWLSIGVLLILEG